MGDFNEFPIRYRLFLKTYPWRRIDPVPWAPLQKSLADSQLVLVSSAGMTRVDQKPFDHSVRGGDPSFRMIAQDTAISDLIESHRSQVFDHAAIQQDPNLAFPLDRLRELSAAGFIGPLNRWHLSLMGSLTVPGRLIKKTLPQVVPQLLADGVDAALLIPV